MHQSLFCNIWPELLLSLEQCCQLPRLDPHPWSGHLLPPDPAFSSCIYGTQGVPGLQLRKTLASVNCLLLLPIISWKGTQQLLLTCRCGSQERGHSPVNRHALCPSSFKCRSCRFRSDREIKWMGIMKCECQF